QIFPKSELEPGPFKDQIEVGLVYLDGQREERLAVLPVQGVVRTAVRPFPARVILPSVKVGDTATGYVHLQAAPGAEFSVGQIETDSTLLSVEPALLAAPSSGQKYRVAFRVERPGDHTGVVVFT